MLDPTDLLPAVNLGLVFCILAVLVWALYRSLKRSGPDFDLHNKYEVVTSVQLPREAKPYKKVPPEGYWTVDQIPKMILSRHNTKAGVWGLIKCTKGILEYKTLEGDIETIQVSPGKCGVAAPRQAHVVKPLTEDCEMCIVFHSIPIAGDEDAARQEKRE